MTDDELASQQVTPKDAIPRGVYLIVQNAGGACGEGIATVTAIAILAVGAVAPSTITAARPRAVRGVVALRPVVHRPAARGTGTRGKVLVRTRSQLYVLESSGNGDVGGGIGACNSMWYGCR